MIGGTGVRRDSEKANVSKLYKGKETVKSLDRPRPKVIRQAKKNFFLVSHFACFFFRGPLDVTLQIF